MKELEVYKNKQSKQDSIMIDFRIKSFKKDFEKYIVNT